MHRLLILWSCRLQCLIRYLIMKRFSSLYPIPEEGSSPDCLPFETITSIDHQVFKRGGATSNIERLPSRPQQSKSTGNTDLTKRIEEYEVSYLQAELCFYKESYQVLLEFYQSTSGILRMMDGKLSRTDWIGIWTSGAQSGKCQLRSLPRSSQVMIRVA